MKTALVLLALVALLAGCSAYVQSRAAGREAEAEDAFPPAGRLIEVEGRTVHVRVTGAGPDVVLIHGASGNLRDWGFGFTERLADRYRVIAFDRPGLGYTDRTDPDYAAPFSAEAESPQEQARLLAAAARRLGVDEAVVVGHSYGGAVAFAWALNEGDTIGALVSVSGVAMPWPGGLGALYDINGSSLGGAVVPPLITAFAREEQVEGVISSIFEPNAAPEGYAGEVGAGLSIRRGTLRANARQVSTLRPHVVEMSERYDTLDLPVEIVHGEADTIVPPDIHSIPASRIIDGANLTLLPGIGHMPHHAARDAVIDAIDRAAGRAGLR